METKFDVKFFVKKSKLLSNGNAPIFVRLILGDEILDFGTKRNCNPSQWESTTSRVMCNSNIDDEVENVNSTNDYLRDLKKKLKAAKTQLEELQEPITLENIRSRAKGEKKAETTILVLFDKHNTECRELSSMGKKFAKATVQRYETTQRHIADYIHSEYKKQDLNIKFLDNRFIKGFQHYLMTKRNCCNNTTIKYIKNFKKIVKIAFAQGYISNDPFNGINYKMDDVDVEFLELDEIYSIMNKEITINRLEVVRDIFVFCCFTGLAYSDVKELSREHIVKKANDDNLWITKKRKKTKIVSNIPLLDIAKNILDKYSFYPYSNKGKLLPVLTNQKMNGYLKEIGDLCEIKKHLTMHMARHSFATSVALDNGISLEAVAGMLGHSTTRLTRRYARIREKLISSDFNKIKDKFNNASQINSNYCKPNQIAEKSNQNNLN